MILLLMLLSLALLVAGGLVLWSVASRARRGYEDGTGFHLVTTLSGEVTVPDPGLDPARGIYEVGHAEAGATTESARAPDLELPFGVF
jgi:hypothetical protein